MKDDKTLSLNIIKESVESRAKAGILSKEEMGGGASGSRTRRLAEELGLSRQATKPGKPQE